MNTEHPDTASDQSALTLEALLSENDKLKKKLDLMENTLQKCSSCESRVEKKRLRICVDCCSKDNLVHFDANKDLIILDLHEVQPSLICGTCCLEGTHEGHNTSLYEPVRLRSTASRQFDELRSSFQEKYRSSLADINLELRTALFGLDKPLNEMQEKAMKLRRSVDLEAQVSLVKQFEEEFDEIMGNFIKQGEESVQQIKDIEERLVKATKSLQIDEESKGNGKRKKKGKGKKKGKKEDVHRALPAYRQSHASFEAMLAANVQQVLNDTFAVSDYPYLIPLDAIQRLFEQSTELGLKLMKEGKVKDGAVMISTAISLNLYGDDDDELVEMFKGLLEPDQFKAVQAALPAARKRATNLLRESHQKESTDKKQ